MNVRRAVMPVVCLLVAVGTAFAQHRVDPGNMYARIYAIVPMVGSGTGKIPGVRCSRRSLNRQPLRGGTQQTTPGTRTGIIAFNSSRV